ncbi:pheromone receptor [Sordaria brevicollis]|uniref:Pheromone receptor n=1 Tax=Sordaria brevicollis TaxID=83679 RepID=A0AAE0PIV2_SORBR|nr:pheromone receptor [Sordaria brevicollis]
MALPADASSGINTVLNSSYATLILPVPPADQEHLENQLVFFFDNHGQLLNVSIAVIDDLNGMLISSAVNYATQIGATFIMLAIMLLMTPRRRFKRLPTVISLLALLLNLIRVVLLTLFYPSHWTDFYVLWSGDWSFVPLSDMHISVTATVLSIPVTTLLLMALMVQAWSMMQLWEPLWRALVVSISALLILGTVILSFVNCIFQVENIINAVPFPPKWVRQLYLAMTTGSISWFTFLFMIRLVLHMWTNRSILPSMKGLKPMDVLIITNAILMLVPVVFAGLEFLDPASGFESGSLTQTSVVIVLPLGTLVAQRIATRGYMPDSEFSGGGPNGSHPLSDMSLPGTKTDNGHKDKAADNGIIFPNNNNNSFGNNINCLPKVSSKGGKRMTASSASSSQRPLLTTTNSTITTDSQSFPSPSLHNTTSYTMQFPPVPYPGYNTRTTGVTSHIASDGHHLHINHPSSQQVNRHPSVDHFDRELARIDDEDDLDDDLFEPSSEKGTAMHTEDLERGRSGANANAMGGVRVERTIETRSEERVPSPNPQPSGLTQPRSFE